MQATKTESQDKRKAGAALHPTKNDLPAESRKALVELLNERLSELIDLQLQAKQAHWNVKGPHFFQLHELFDATATLASEFVDLVAERATALGGTAEGTVQVVSVRTQLEPYPLNITAGMDHVDRVSSALAAVGKTIRASIDKANEFADADTVDLFTEISRGLDKQLWFVEAHQQGNG